MSDPAPHTPPRAPLVLLGVLAAFASFAVIAAVLQTYAGGRPSDPLSEVRLKNKAEIAEAQSALLKKSGLTDNADAVIARAVEQIAMRKLEASKVVVPGSPTAIKQSAPAPGPAAIPASAAAPVSPPAVPSTPPPVPVPVTPPPAPPVPGTASK